MAISTINQNGLNAPLSLTSPVLTTPNLGTPSALVLTNATGTPAAINLTNATALPASALPSGSVIQTVYSVINNNSSTSTSSTSFTSTGHTLTITPRYSNSKILLTVCSYCYNSYSGWGSAYTIYKNGSNVISVGGGGNTVLYGIRNDSNSNGQAFNVNIVYMDAPATTSALTYTVYQLSNNGANTTFYAYTAGSQVNYSAATFVAQEIAG